MARQFERVEIPPAPNLAFERRLWDDGFKRVAGVDEAGRGAWAGPVSAGAVILPPGEAILHMLSGVRDSKQMRPEARAIWAEEIRLRALACAVGFASSEEIDALGIVPATRLAMQRAIEGLSAAPQHILIDALRLVDNALPQTALIKGDARSLSIAAASVLAKTARDAWMVDLESMYPGYAFARHKGYGTAAHQEALVQLGPAPVHRRCFAPVAACFCPPAADTKPEAA